jgi:hypothetical protein
MMMSLLILNIRIYVYDICLDLSIIDDDTTTIPPGRNLFDTELILSVYILHVNEYIKLDFMSV